MFNFKTVICWITFWGLLTNSGFTLANESTVESIAEEHQEVLELARVENLMIQLLTSKYEDSTFEQFLYEIQLLPVDATSCYEHSVPVITEYINQTNEMQDIYGIVKLADRFMMDFNNDTLNDVFQLVGDEVFQTVSRNLKREDVNWKCNLLCECNCDKTIHQIRARYRKNGYTLSLAQPDKVKICREIRGMSFGYLLKKYKDRCWIDCLNHGNWSGICLASLGLVLLFSILVVFKLGIWIYT